jgi:hypothetical protein
MVTCRGPIAGATINDAKTDEPADVRWISASVDDLQHESDLSTVDLRATGFNGSRRISPEEIKRIPTDLLPGRRR